MSDILAATILEVFGIIGVVVLIVLAAGVAFVGYHIWRFKRAIGQIGEQFKAYGEIMKGGIVPKTLGLEAIDDDLLDQPALLAAVAQLQAAGLRRGGTYTLSLMPALRMVTLADPARRVTAAVNVSPSHGMNVDVVTMFADGGALTHRTMPSIGLDFPPQFEQHTMTGAPPQEVLEEHLASRDPTRAAREIAPEDVAEAMEEYNAETVRWRDGRGGLTPTEVRRTARATGHGELDPHAMQMLLATSRIEADSRLADAMRDAFLAASGWTDDDWAERGDAVVFVTDDMSVEEVMAEFGLDVEAADPAALIRAAAADGTRNAFAALAASTASPIERLATFDAPQPTDAYVARG